MNLLFDKATNDAADQAGAVDLKPVTSSDWFTGTGKEAARAGSNIGIQAQRVFGQMDSTAADALGVNRALSRNGKIEQIHDITPTAPEDLPKYEKPDAYNSGKVAILLGDLLEQAPTLAGALVNPAVGFAAGVSSGADKGREEANTRGLKGNDALMFSGLQALEDGIGGAMPGIGGIGEKAMLKYGSRFVVGGGVNEAQSEVFKFGRAEVLDQAGFTGQATEMRQFDLQASAATFIMGGLFNLGGGHVRDRTPETPRTTPDAVPPELQPEAPAATVVDGVAQTPPAPVQTGARLSRGEVKEVKSAVVNSQRHLDRLDAERQAVLSETPTGSGKALAEARANQQARLADIETQRVASLEINQSAQTRLSLHEEFNRSRITVEQGDAATHALMHDNLVHESAPGLSADAVTVRAHTGAMASAMESIHTGKAVDVSDNFSGDHTFVIHGDGGLDAGNQERAGLSGRASLRADAVSQAAAVQTVPEPRATAPVPGQISEHVANPFDMLRAQVDTLRTEHPELAESMAPHVERIQQEHTTAQAEASQYEVAAACALSYGA